MNGWTADGEKWLKPDIESLMSVFPLIMSVIGGKADISPSQHDAQFLDRQPLLGDLALHPCARRLVELLKAP